jgi:hypothetical protein
VEPAARKGETRISWSFERTQHVCWHSGTVNSPGTLGSTSSVATRKKNQGPVHFLTHHTTFLPPRALIAAVMIALGRPAPGVRVTPQVAALCMRYASHTPCHPMPCPSDHVTADHAVLFFLCSASVSKMMTALLIALCLGGVHAFTPPGRVATFATFGNAQTKELIQSWQPKPLSVPNGSVFLPSSTENVSCRPLPVPH